MKSMRFLAATALASTTLVLAAGPAWAQAAASDATKPKAEEEAKADDIVVVGSRIRRDVFDGASPVEVITRDEATLAGFASTTEVLQSSQVTGGTSQINNSFGGFVTDGGPGANTLSLRGLGATRTLLLLNGRRVAPAGTRGSVGATDLNVLPNAIIDRIEILKDGASSIYGSDAVAGVVNVVTRNKISGATVEGQYNATNDGGGNEQRVSAVLGLTGDRFSISASFDIYKRDNLTLADRDWTQCNTDYRILRPGNNLPGSGDFIDPRTGQPKCYPITGTGSNGVTINTIGTNTRAGVGAAGSVGTTFNRWRPNSAVTTGLVGFEGVGGGANNLNVRDTFDPKTLNRSLISPAKVYTGFLQASYDTDALGGAEIYFELLGNKRQSSQVGYRQLSLDYSRGNILLPSTLATSQVQAAPTPITNGLPLGVRAFIGFGNDKSEQSVSFWKGTVGLKGDFIFPNWRYDAYFGSSWSSGSYTFQSFLTDRLAQSLNVVAAGTGFACVNPANGCVAAPALTSAVIGGQLPQSWVNFVFQPVVGKTKYTEKVANFTVDGSLFRLPYGDVKTALGMEYRTAKIDDTPPIDSQTGNLYNLTSAAITRGKDSVWEAFGEVEIPLVRNVAFAKDLTLNASARYTHYKSYGGDYTYKIGGIYAPTGWLSFRGTYGTSYRAPALFEQFLGGTSGFLGAANDPCNNWDALPAGDIRRANCASEGLPAGFNATSGITVITSGGAAAGLKAETSKNWTVGTIFEPKLPASIGSLSVAVDYYNVTVNNGVARAGAGNILGLCYDDAQFRAGGGFCRLINARTPGSNALTVNDSYVNLATDKVRGIDYTVRFARDIGEGNLRLTARVTQFLEQANKLFADDPLDDVNGTVTNPKFTGNFDLLFKMKKWRVRYGLEWIDGQSDYEYLGLDPTTTIFKFDVPDYYLHNASVQYSTDKFSITAGVNNITNKEPPQISSGRYNRIGNAPLYSGYDYAGRTYFVNFSKSF
jgi:iron complex outermembrane recepter protein